LEHRLQRNCPICDAHGGRLLRTVSGWEIIRCPNCAFVYTPTVRQTTASEVDLPKGYTPIWRARHRQIYHLIERKLRPGELIVDVGAGFAELGRIVHAASKHRYIGFEPSRSVSWQAAQRGILVRQELFTSDSLDQPADAVVLDNVLEHVSDPVALLQTCVGALRPGGLLVVIVPNCHDVRQIAPSWRRINHWIPPEHINYFTSQSLTKIMRDVGLRPRPFGFKALGAQDFKYWPRAILELLRVFPFGLNMYGDKL
jgi:SAM-dependent methyltransferase